MKILRRVVIPVGRILIKNEKKKIFQMQNFYQ